MDMKTAISIPDPLFEAVEQLAQRLGISRSELYQRAVRDFLRVRRGESVTEALDEIYSAEDECASLDPVLAELQRASFEVEEW